MSTTSPRTRNATGFQFVVVSLVEDVDEAVQQALAPDARAALKRECASPEKSSGDPSP